MPHTGKLWPPARRAESLLGASLTGAATQRNIARGREPTEQERKDGIVLPMEELTNEEKVQDALRISLTHRSHLLRCGRSPHHIQRMNELNDLIMEATT